MMSCTTIAIAALALLFGTSSADDPCRYETSKGVIDLTSVGKTGGKAAFRDVTPSIGSNYKYSYNPCKPFTEGTSCVDVAACQVSNDGKLQFAFGKQESVVWSPAGVGGNPSISYWLGAKKVTVNLACPDEGESTKFEALGESPINTYRFLLTHRCVCWDGCKAVMNTSTTQSTTLPPCSSTPVPKPPKGYLSGLIVFLIILGLLAFAFCVTFTIYYFCFFQRSGPEVIVYQNFSAASPVFSQHGVTYPYQQAAGKGAGSYEQL